MLSPATGLRSYGLRYALDNGAWTAHKTGTSFDADRFRRALERIGAGADFIVLPDIVGGGMRSLELSASWLDEVGVFERLMLIPVQEGMDPECLNRFDLGQRLGIFLGGLTDEWKEGTMSVWGYFAAQTGCYYHVARVNSQRRIRIAQYSGADSIDGSSVSRFAITAKRLDPSVRQGVLWTVGDEQKS